MSIEVDLSIIIVNYKTPQLLLNCLGTLYAFESRINKEIVVVDNASGDNSRSVVSESFPAVKWIQMNYNAGFARANNEAIRQSAAKAVLLLNSDTLVEDDAVHQSFLKLMQSDYLGCGVQLLNTDRSPQISGNYFVMGSLNNLLPLPYIGGWVKWLGNLFRVKKPNIPETKAEVEVDWINGAFLMVKKSAIDKAGLMDEDFFLYAEEAEWCSRLRKFGKLCIYGQFHVVHLQGETATAAFGSGDKGYYNLYDRKGLQLMLSNFVRIRKQNGTGWYLFHLLVYFLTIPVFFVAGFIHNIFLLRSPFAHFKQAAGFGGNVLRLFSFLPSVVLNKPHFYKVL